MTSLPFKTNIDFIFSAFDSVNYLLRHKDLAALFRGVSRVLDDEGSFTFDVSLESNSIYLVKPQTIQGRKNGFRYERISFYKKLGRIHHNRFYISDGHSNNYRGDHKQKIYKLETYFKLAESCGFKVTACYDCFTFKDIKSNSNRAQFVFKKIKSMMLSFDNVEFHYKNQPVFTNLNMQLDYGEFVFVIGKSGIGKSTLMQLIYMNLFPLTGTVKIAEFDSQTMKPYQIPLLRRKIGVIFQDFKLLPDRNVFQNLAYVLKVTGAATSEIKKKIKEVLAKVGRC